MGVAAAIVAGAVLLAWPALLNGYPILFSDTHAFLVQAGQPRMVWDKPFVYGPFLRALHLDASLWGPAAGQAVLLSHLIWVVADRLGRAAPWRHLLVVAVLAAASAAPWFAVLLMPDIFTPVTVLCLFALGFDPPPGRLLRAWLVLLGTLAIATHLSHLPLAAALLLVLALLRGRRAWRAALPLGAALALLLATNLVGFGRLSVSPYGSVFALARLVADGPAAATIRQSCPGSGWRLCAWSDRLPTDSDDFLWNGKGPIWSDPGGPAALAPEAGAILWQTLRDRPAEVAIAFARNFARQAMLLRLGDTLGPEWLAQSVLGSLRAYFPPAEAARFFAARQIHDTLRPVAAGLSTLHMATLAAGALVSLGLALRRPRSPAGALALLILVALLVNAAVTGGLSTPHDRYQARLAWLVLLPALLGIPRRSAGSRP